MQHKIESAVLRTGDALPFFDVATVDGGRVRYADLWQRKNVVLVCLLPRATAADAAYANELLGRSSEFDAYCASCVVTRDGVLGVPSPGVAIADRWGEVQQLASSAAVADLPKAGELLDTLDYLQRRCPECEGEWR